VSLYLNEKLVFKWWHITTTLFTFRRFRFRNIASFFFAIMRRFHLRNIASFSSSQHCVVFVFSTLRRFCKNFATSYINSSMRSARKILIHLILIARCEVLAKISHISTSHTNNSMRSSRKNLIHLILIARCEVLAKISYISY
jgi:hypothetical protein